MATNPDNVGGLLPCPFCGCAMQISSSRDWHRVVGDHDGDCLLFDADGSIYPATDEGKAEALATWNRRELCRAAPAGGEDHLRRLVGKLDQWRLSMSYNDSYFGEPAGLLKSTVEELARAVDPIYPPKPAPKDPLAGVTIYSATVTLSAAAPAVPKDSAPAGGDDWPFLEEIGRDGKPTGYWVRKGSPAAARMSAPAGSGEVEELRALLSESRQYIKGDRHRRFATGYLSTDEHDDLLRRIQAALLRKLQQGADYVMVPREPTGAMVAMGEHWYDRAVAGIDREEDAVENIWTYMIAASQGQEGGTNG